LMSSFKSMHGLNALELDSAAVPQLHDGPGELWREINSLKWTLAAGVVSL